MRRRSALKQYHAVSGQSIQSTRVRSSGKKSMVIHQDRVSIMRVSLAVISCALLAVQVSSSEELVTRSNVKFVENVDNWRYDAEQYRLVFYDIDWESNATNIFFHYQLIGDNAIESNPAINCTFAIKRTSHFKEKKGDESSVGYEWINLDSHRILFFISTLYHSENYARQWEVSILDSLSCRAIEQKFSLYADQVVLEDNSLNVYFTNSSLCGDKYCKMTLDSELNVVETPKPSIHLNTTNKIRKISKLWQTDGVTLIYFYKTIGLLTKEGIKPVTEFTEIINNGKYLLHGFSYNYDIISISDSDNFEENSTKTITIRVIRYDLNGDIKLQVKLNYSEISAHLALLNLKGGGFLLNTSKYVGSEYKLYVTKYNAEGQVVSQPLEIGGFVDPFRSFDLFPFIQFYEKASGFYCLIQHRFEWPEKCGSQKCVGFFETCFRDKDLKSL